MIARQEILDLARELQLRPEIVEKDYVLGWLLAGIHAHDELRAAWVFKGGTCLKKCYFETYRFSEDLDFTLSATRHLDATFLRQAFTKIAAWIYEHAGIEISVDDLRFKIYDDKRGGTGGQGKVSYRGPLAPRGSPPRVKLDLTSNELLALEPVEADLRHPYSDAASASFRTTAYAFEEVFAEKVRALAERPRPLRRNPPAPSPGARPGPRDPARRPG